MTLSRRIAALMLLAGGTLGLVAVGGAQPPGPGTPKAVTPFAWTKYTGKDGNQYDNPQWGDDAGKRTLAGATGRLTYTDNPPITKVIFKVYQQAPQGGWVSTPVISYPIDPLPRYQDGVGWVLNGQDPNNLNGKGAVRFTEGETLKMVWEVTTTQNGTDSTNLVELPVAVNYH